MSVQSYEYAKLIRTRATFRIFDFQAVSFSTALSLSLSLLSLFLSYLSAFDLSCGCGRNTEGGEGKALWLAFLFLAQRSWVRFSAFSNLCKEKLNVGEIYRQRSESGQCKNLRVDLTHQVLVSSNFVKETLKMRQFGAVVVGRVAGTVDS